MGSYQSLLVRPASDRESISGGQGVEQWWAQRTPSLEKLLELALAQMNL